MTKNLLFFLRVYILVLNTKRKIGHAKSRKKIQLGKDVNFEISLEIILTISFNFLKSTGTLASFLRLLK